ncbi:hypothetical protein [Maribacter sp. 2307UL18-2]|uniref:hypothetical protein n=1 Tax=Maribacter sp. 2307UL18-2 TaxID=3386274 RepID=UPI0039BCE252
MRKLCKERSGSSCDLCTVQGMEIQNTEITIATTMEEKSDRSKTNSRVGRTWSKISSKEKEDTQPDNFILGMTNQELEYNT